MDRRLILTAAGASPRAAADRVATPLDAQVVRTGPGGLRLTWTGARTVSVFVSSDPTADRPAMRALRTASGGGADLVAPPSPRPYFLARAADGRQVRIAERLLPLQGGRNFRDLGGWRTADGQQVRWGRLYRSGVMNGLTLADLDYLRGLGIVAICDLRAPSERDAEPNPFLKIAGPNVVAIGYDRAGAVSGLMKMTTREQTVQGFADAYVDFLDLLAPHFTDLFARLVAGQAPLAFNCSAGKDRTGMASALVLSVLGVPRQTVIADYALSETYVPPALYLEQMARGEAIGGFSLPQTQALAKLPPEVLKVILGADPEVMRRALAIIDARYGGPTAVAKARFGLTEGKIAALRRAYLY